jgi:hypothetical protein
MTSVMVSPNDGNPDTHGPSAGRTVQPAGYETEMPLVADVNVSDSAGGAVGEAFGAVLSAGAGDDGGGCSMLGGAEGAVDAAPVQPASRASKTSAAALVVVRRRSRFDGVRYVFIVASLGFVM